MNTNELPVTVITLANLQKYDGELKSYITQLLAAVAAGLIKMQKVQTLPPVAEAATNTIYLVPNTKQSGNNIYDEYALIDGAFELLGTTQIDVDNKADKVGEAFSTTKAYAVGEYVTYNNKLWKCKSAHSAGAWNADHFDEVTGNFAALDKDGNLSDSGKKTADFATAAQGAKADTALQPGDLVAATDAQIEAMFENEQNG